MVTIKELYFKDTLSNNERLVLEFVKTGPHPSLMLGGDTLISLKNKMTNSPLTSKKELFDILAGENIEYIPTPVGNGYKHNFCIKSPIEKINYVKELTAKAGYRMIDNSET